MKKTFALLTTAIVSMFVLCGCNREAQIEEKATELVTEILQTQLKESNKCTEVEITKKISDDKYEAKATLDNGEKIKISIKDQGSMIFVELDKTVNLERSSVRIVTDILNNQFNVSAKCTKVEISEKISDKKYSAKATLDNGNDIKIIIEDRGDQIYVTIPFDQD